MFDLFRSREKTVRYILGAVLTLVALSMVITLIPGYGSGIMKGDSQVVAEIGNDQITAQEVRSAMQIQMKQNQIPPQMAQMYMPMLVQSMVAERASAYYAKQMGFMVSEEELANAIQSMLPSLFEGGKFVGRDVYASFLAQQNMTIPVFENNIRGQLMMTKLETIALEGVVVSPQEVEAEFKRNNEKIKLSYVGITPEAFQSQVTVTPADMTAFWAKNKAGFTIPEKRSFVVYALDPAKMEASIQAPEAELRKFYDSNRERFRTPERVHIRHILLRTNGKSKEDVAKLQKKAEDLQKQAKSGANFADLATKNSEDPGSAAKGGDLDWVTRGQTVPEFEKAAFAMKPGEVSGVITTTYGFHILKCEAKEDAHLKPFDEVKAQLAKEAVRTQVFDKMEATAEQIHTALTKNPADADKIALAAGITPVRVTNAGDADPVPDVGVNSDFRESIRSLAKGGVTPVISLPGNKLVVAQVTDIVKMRPAEMSEVEARVRAQVQMIKAQDLAKVKAKEAEAYVKAHPGDLAGLAKAMALPVKSTALFGRDGAAEGIGAAAQVEVAFGKSAGEVFGPVNTTGGTFFCKLDEKAEADLTQFAAQRERLTENMKMARARQRRDLMFDGIVNTLVKQKKLKMNEDLIRRISTSYGG
jgi:peptidyl-prolyl cis-trans isomerase D